MANTGTAGGSFSGSGALRDGGGSAADQPSRAADSNSIQAHVRGETTAASLTDRSPLASIQSMEAARNNNTENAQVNSILSNVTIGTGDQIPNSDVTTNNALVAWQDHPTLEFNLNPNGLVSPDAIDRTNLSPFPQAAPAHSAENSSESGTDSTMSPRGNLWDDMVSRYVNEGSVEMDTVPGIAQAMRQLPEIGAGNRGEVYQSNDPNKVVKEGDYYEIVAQAAAFSKLRAETNFVVPNSRVLLDPAAPGKAFLEMDKLDFVKPGQLYDANSPYLGELTTNADAVLEGAEKVLELGFTSDLKPQDNWAVLNNPQTMAKLDKGRSLSQSDIVIYDPVSYFASLEQ